ncbi:TIGR02234 family membrane protein [Mycobacterium sp. ACS4331]|uniref:TIGR02234 family membrane protein n=1 Tax=Mycobacterium sp. ACS4331 TaxID=1834121 RepID=UPI0007FF0E72|nr:TIGR02234 family membrane protein [Mycobacterium sp. ACS4331]OBF11715.1 hypothetical protein A5727_19645 [Mycobacterium sp. ACS4331]
MTDTPRRGTVRGLRIGQLLLVIAALLLWGAARLTWVVLHSSDGLGQPKTVDLAGSTWSTALLPVALLLAAAVVATLAVRGWPLRAVAGLLAVVSAGLAYLAVTQWVVPDVDERAAQLAQIPFADQVITERQYAGAVCTLIAAACTLVAAVLLIRSATAGRRTTSRYAAPGARRAALQADTAQAQTPGDAGASPSQAGLSERMIWDALDEGHDPTVGESDDRPDPSAEGR